MNLSQDSEQQPPWMAAGVCFHPLTQIIVLSLFVPALVPSNDTVTHITRLRAAHYSAPGSAWSGPPSVTHSSPSVTLQYSPGSSPLYPGSHILWFWSHQPSAATPPILSSAVIWLLISPLYHFVYSLCLPLSSCQVRQQVSLLLFLPKLSLSSFLSPYGSPSIARPWNPTAPSVETQ